MAALLYVALDLLRSDADGVAPTVEVATEVGGDGAADAVGNPPATGERVQPAHSAVDDAEEHDVDPSAAPEDFALELFVTDAATGEALVEAQLAFRGEVVAETDGDGRAIVPLDEEAFASRNVVQDLWVRRSGYGPAVVFVDRHEPGGRVAVALHRGAILRGRLVGLMDGEEAALHVSADTVAFLQPADSFGSSYGRHSWDVTVDANGGVEVVDLPPNVWLWLSASSNRRDALRLQAGPLLLQPAETHSAEWDFAIDSKISGTVVDADGRAFAGMRVRALSHRSGRWSHTYTDEAGRFELGPLRAGKYFLSGTHEGEDQASAVEDREVDVATAETMDVTLVAEEAASVAGRVFEASGSPIEGAIVHLSRAGRYLNSKRTAADGSFTFTLVPVGPCELYVSRSRNLDERPPARANVSAPAVDLELRFEVGGALSGFLLDPLTGEHVRGTVHSSCAGDDCERFAVDSDDEGRFEVGGLCSRPHSLVAVAEDGRIGTLSEVIALPGERTDDLEIPVQPGGELVVARCSGVAPYLQVHCGKVHITSGTTHGANALIFVVPAGELELEVVESHAFYDSSDDEVIWSRRITVAAGERVEVSFD